MPSQLNSAIEQWRSHMAEGGLHTTEVLDELESHLRDDIDAQIAAGMGEQQAFATSAARLGQADMLKKEFDKVGGTVRRRIKTAWLTLAGIPHFHQTSSMNLMNSPSHLEPRWATYTKAALFLSPALFLWTIAALFLMPKLQVICREAGVALPWVSQVTNSLSNNVLLVTVAVLLPLVVLEWRWNRWPQFRRVTLGSAVFVLNATVMALLTLMLIFALVAAPKT
jgi:hypothetical protein